MKIFWSWQSDTDGKTGRHFVRKALNAAIAYLKEQEDVEEPDEKARLAALHSDAGVEGIPGSPEIAREIFRKINGSAVVIADVTPVGKTKGGKDENGKRITPKALMNPNVAIELGYAMNKPEGSHFLMVMNTHYGDRSSVPFDLAGRNGPIMYKLAPDTTKEEYDAEFAKLRGQFVVALRPFLALPAPVATSPAPFVPRATTFNSAAFWQMGEILVRYEADLARWAGKPEEIYEFRFTAPTALYMRVMPMTPLAEELKMAKLKEATDQRPRVMTRTEYGSRSDRNEYGAIAYEENPKDNTLIAFMQFFTNGEVWAVSHDLTRSFSDGLVISVPGIQKAMGDTLWQIIQLMNGILSIPAPYKVVMGAVGIKGGRLGLGNYEHSAVIHVPEVSSTSIIKAAEKQDVSEVIEDFLDEFCDKADVKRQNTARNIKKIIEGKAFP